MDRVVVTLVRKSQLSACHLSIEFIPSVIAHRSIAVVLTDFETSFQRVISIDKSQVTIIAHYCTHKSRLSDDLVEDSPQVVLCDVWKKPALQMQEKLPSSLTHCEFCGQDTEPSVHSSISICKNTGRQQTSLCVEQLHQLVLTGASEEFAGRSISVTW